VQEALTNIVKHARAERVSVVLQTKPSTVTAVIEDDGRGFPDGEASSEGIGLIGMRERVGLVGGRLEVESSSSGTTIVVEVPL
jgi:two-component system sensor histidine kinase DegS